MIDEFYGSWGWLRLGFDDHWSKEGDVTMMNDLRMVRPIGSSCSYDMSYGRSNTTFQSLSFV